MTCPDLQGAGNAVRLLLSLRNCVLLVGTSRLGCWSCGCHRPDCGVLVRFEPGELGQRRVFQGGGDVRAGITGAVGNKHESHYAGFLAMTRISSEEKVLVARQD